MMVARVKSSTDPDKSIREHVVALLTQGNAHVTFDDAVKGLAPKFRGVRPQSAHGPLLPYSAWELLEHIRIAQWDILDFSRNPKYKAMKWPEGYWPKSPEPPTATAWDKSIKQVKSDLKEMVALINDPKADLYAEIPWGDGQTILREALLIADHNAYHVGELIAVRRALGAWK
jgi:hypothetical protein